MHRRLATALIPVLFTLACGGDSPTGPSNNSIPNVAGSYTGSTTVSYPERALTVTCPASTSVTQASGGRVSIAPILLGGPCQGLSVPIGDVTIDATGSIGAERGSYYDASCGGTYDYGASGGFFGRTLQASLVYTSRVCWNMNITFNLSR